MLGPAAAAIIAGEDLRVVPHGPAVFVIDEKYRREQLASRHLGLGPGLALVVRIDNVPAVTDRHQALAGVDHIEHQGFAGLGRFDGIDDIGRRRRNSHHRCRQHRRAQQRERRSQQRDSAQHRRPAAAHSHDRLIHRPFPHYYCYGLVRCQSWSIVLKPAI